MESDDERPVKKPRVFVACSLCRSKKRRCDGGRPTCQACESRELGALCSYEPVSERKYTSFLESKVKDLMTLVAEKRPSTHQVTNASSHCSPELGTVSATYSRFNQRLCGLVSKVLFEQPYSLLSHWISRASLIVIVYYRTHFFILLIQAF